MQVYVALMKHSEYYVIVWFWRNNVGFWSWSINKQEGCVDDISKMASVWAAQWLNGRRTEPSKSKDHTTVGGRIQEETSVTSDFYCYLYNLKIQLNHKKTIPKFPIIDLQSSDGFTHRWFPIVWHCSCLVDHESRVDRLWWYKFSQL